MCIESIVKGLPQHRILGQQPEDLLKDIGKYGMLVYFQTTIKRPLLGLVLV